VGDAHSCGQVEGCAPDLSRFARQAEDKGLIQLLVITRQRIAAAQLLFISL
jgi:hypothetical protein